MEREQLEPLVNQHLSIRAIADRLSTSPTTIRWWLQKYGLTTSAPRGRYTQQLPGPCRWHLCSNPAMKGGFCSPQCKSKHFVDQHRKALKVRAVAVLGGRCLLCGYDKYIGALEFHHLDPSQKDFNISKDTRSWDRILEELRKCVLLCSNCHAEVHGGVVTLPLAGTGGIEPPSTG